MSVRLPLISGSIFPLWYLHMNFQRERMPSVSSYTASLIHHPAHYVESLYDDLQEQFLVCFGFRRRCTSKQFFLAFTLWKVYIL